MPITLVLADHQPIVLDGLTQLFAHEQDFFVLASHTNSAETLESMRRHRPAVLVLGVGPPATYGVSYRSAVPFTGPHALTGLNDEALEVDGAEFDHPEDEFALDVGC